MRVRPLASAASLAFAATIACGGEEKKSDEQALEECASAKAYFAREVWAPVMGQICIDCHAPGGVAPASGASFVLMPPGYPGFLDHNFEEVRRIAETTYDGTPFLLLKPTGGLSHGGGEVIQPDGPEYQALAGLVDQLAEVSECETTAAPDLTGVALLGPAATLRKAALQLAGRLPTASETDGVVSGGEEALPAAIDALLEEPAFLDRMKELWNDELLTDQFLSYGGRALNALDDEDFPVAATYYDTLTDDERTLINRSVAREPLDLIGYIVSQNRPFSEVLTAGYTVVNDATSAVYNIAPPAATYATVGDLREGSIVSLRDGAQAAWPHAGVLTSPMFLNRFPTTPTNRNRHRARKIFEIFLATNILEIAERPIDSEQSAKYINPTRDDPTCNQCHRQIDPVAGAFLMFDDNSQASLRPDWDWHPEMFAPGFDAEVMDVSEFARGPQWLAERMAVDPRFSLAVVYTLHRALTGQEPIAYPEDPSAEDYGAQLGAWEAQQATFEAIRAEFDAADRNVKVAVRAIVLSPYFRALGIAEDATEEQVAQLAGVGTARLSTPEALARKIQAVTGIPWAREWDMSSWLATDYRILYGGIDSDNVVERLAVPNGLMAAVQDRMANEVACTAVAWDFLQPEADRHLFRHVSLTDTGEAAVRENLQYLHAHVLGEDLETDSAEIDRTYAIFSETLAEGLAKIESGEVNGWLPWACQGRRNPITDVDLPDAEQLRDDEGYVVRAWMAVITYLLTDYHFLYE